MLVFKLRVVMVIVIRRVGIDTLVFGERGFSFLFDVFVMWSWILLGLTRWRGILFFLRSGYLIFLLRYEKNWDGSTCRDVEIISTTVVIHCGVLQAFDFCCVRLLFSDGSCRHSIQFNQRYVFVFSVFLNSLILLIR